jgi:hypothetical protein
MTANETHAPAFRFLGTTDECVDCQREGCPKMDLKYTVAIMPLDKDGTDEGEATYYGSSCAARALGFTGKGAAREVLNAARGAAYRTRANAEDARRMLKIYGLPETGEPTVDEMRGAVRLYIRNHYNISRSCRETGLTVSDMVRDMITRKRAALADARALKISGY